MKSKIKRQCRWHPGNPDVAIKLLDLINEKESGNPDHALLRFSYEPERDGRPQHLLYVNPPRDGKPATYEIEMSAKNLLIRFTAKTGFDPIVRCATLLFTEIVRPLPDDAVAKFQYRILDPKRVTA